VIPNEMSDGVIIVRRAFVTFVTVEAGFWYYKYRRFGRSSPLTTVTCPLPRLRFAIGGSEEGSACIHVTHIRRTSSRRASGYDTTDLGG